MFPKRHRELEGCQRRAKKFRWLVRGGATLTQKRWQQFGEGFTQGDPLADEVIAWLHGYGMQDGWALFERAVKNGSDSLSAAEREQAAPLLRFMERVEQAPQWLDQDLLAQGSRVLDRSHPVTYYVLRDAGLMAGYLLSDLNKPLILTGALQGGTSRRVAQTMKWFADCAQHGGLERDGAGFSSTLHVRLLHAMIRGRILHGEDWDGEDMGLPINQTDMLATLLAFSALFLGGARLLGVAFTKQESKAVMHLWKYAGWLMGVDEALLPDTENEGRRLLFQLFACYRSADNSSREMGQALMAEVPQIPFPKWRPLMWRFEQAKHLGVTYLFVGPLGMRKLGLPQWPLPLYPLLLLPYNAVRYRLMRFFPAWQRWAERRGHRQRGELVQMHFGIDTPGLADLKTP